MDRKFELLDGGAVISLESLDDVYLIEGKTFRLSDFSEAVEQQFDDDYAEMKWLEKGVQCEVLTPNKSWRKGKLRLCIAFCPDEPELNEAHASKTLNNSNENSPLDDIRATIDN